MPFLAGATGFAVAGLPRGLARIGTSDLAAGFLGVAELEGLLLFVDAK